MKLVQGTIEQISMRPIAGGEDNYGNKFRKSLKMDGVWYGFGGAKKDEWVVKMGNDWKILGKGSQVAFKAEQNGQYWNGKELMVLELVEGNAAGAAPAQSAGGAKAAGGTYQAKPKDMTGVSTGHAFNGAMNFLITYGVEASNENIIRYATSIHNVTEKLKTQGKIKYPDMSDYDLGAMIGNSVLNAAKLVGTEGDFEQGVEGIALDLLDNVVPVISKYVREGKGAAPAPKVTRAPAAAKKTAKAPAAKAPTPAEEPDLPDDADDDLPF